MSSGKMSRGVLGIIPGLGILIPLLVIVWIFVAVLIAIHEAMQSSTYWKPVAVVSIGFVPYVVIIGGLLLVAGQV